MKNGQPILGWLLLSLITIMSIIVATAILDVAIGILIGSIHMFVTLAVKLILNRFNISEYFTAVALVIIVIIALPAVPVALNWWQNSNDPTINAHLQIVAIDPRIGLEGRETVSIEIDDVRGGFGLGTHTISYELFSFPEREHMHGGILYDQDRLLTRWGRNRVDLITQFTFEPHRSYILTVYVNNSAVQFLYGNTLRDEILISSR